MIALLAFGSPTQPATGDGGPASDGAAAERAPAPELPGLDARLDDLRRGGLVLYFRHAATEREGPDESGIDLERCETQRNLSEEGRDQAQRIGAAVRALGIPIGEVVTSPFCRCKETAELAFGDYRTSRDLYFAMDVAPAERERLSGMLRDMLSQQPEPGTNSVIVAHTANLKEAAGLWPKPEGVAYVFRPTGGGFRAVGRIEPGEWTRFAAATAPPKE